jgi:undecaprenyl-diphosphatase
LELWVQAVILGLIQGLTEYLPISSTGHVRISAAFLGINDPGAAFTAVTQVGTALAVAIYFRRDLSQMVQAIWRRDTKSPNFKMVSYMGLATIPIVVFGLAFANFFENEARDLRIIALALIFFGILLWLVDKLAPKVRSTSEIRLKDASLIGFAQALALIPGVSRSGATMTMARYLGFDRVAAARISFLLALPAIILAAAYQMQYIGDESAFNWPLTLLASLIAFVTGYLTIEFILKWLASHTFTIFAGYRVILGLVIFIAILKFNMDPRG